MRSTVTTSAGPPDGSASAGIGGAQAPTGEYPPDSWHQVLGVDLTGVF